jgi:uncharacterized protein YndB with AHSA1/START domain
MPVKKDSSGKRWVEMEVLVIGSPEDVWRALATGPGYGAWFTKAKIEERVGGELEFYFGRDTKTAGQVTFWEPPRAFGYVERDWAEGAPPVATEITITGRPGRECVVKMVHSLFASSDSWDGHLEGFEDGWPGFFEVLRVYLAHFARKELAQAAGVVTYVQGEPLAVWTRLTEALGLAGANAGERRTTSRRPEALTGIVESTVQSAQTRYIVLRVEAPLPGVMLLEAHALSVGVHVNASFYFYGVEAANQVAVSEPLWRSWLAELFEARV